MYNNKPFLFIGFTVYFFDGRKVNFSDYWLCESHYSLVIEIVAQDTHYDGVDFVGVIEWDFYIVNGEHEKVSCVDIEYL